MLCNSMQMSSLTVKDFFNSDFNIHVFMDEKQNVWFKGREIARILEYKDTRRAVFEHVPEENKTKLCDFKGRVKYHPLKNEQPHTILINEPGFYRLIFGSKLELAKKIQKWVCEDVLPSIRKYGFYKLFDKKPDF